MPASGNDFEYSRSLRVFAEGGENCYSLAVPNGRYLVRMLFDYGNYDGLNTVSAGRDAENGKRRLQ